MASRLLHAALCAVLCTLLVISPLQAKARVQGSVRIELERRYGWLTAALVRLNVIRDYTPLLVSLRCICIASCCG